MKCPAKFLFTRLVSPQLSTELNRRESIAPTEFALTRVHSTVFSSIDSPLNKGNRVGPVCSTMVRLDGRKGKEGVRLSMLVASAQRVPSITLKLTFKSGKFASARKADAVLTRGLYGATVHNATDPHTRARSRY